MIPAEEKPWLKYYTEENFKEYDLEKSIYDFMKDINSDYSDDEPAVDFFGKIITRGELLSLSREFGKGMYNLGVNSKDYVVTGVMLTMPETYELIYGASYLGCRINMLDFRNSTPETLAGNINAVKSKLLFIGDLVCSNELVEFLYANTELEHIVVVHVPAQSNNQLSKDLTNILYNAKADSITYDDVKAIKLTRFLELAADSDFTPEMRFKSPRDGFVIAQSSGTSGAAPKKVEASEYMLNLLAKQHLNSRNKMERGDRALDFMPKWAFFGLVGMIWPLCAGMIVSPVMFLRPYQMVELIEKIKPQLAMVSPMFALGLLNSGIKDLSSFKVFIVGGDSVPYEIEGKLNDMFKRLGKIDHISCGYSASENTAVGSVAQYGAYKQGSVGIPYPEMEFMVIDEEAFAERNELVRLPIGQEGIICMGGNLIPGYDELHKDEEARVFRYDDRGDRWFVAEDIGYIDEDGFIFFKNRAKDIIVIKDGTKIIPKPIEDTVRKCSDVKNCAIIGKRRGKNKPGEKICCYLELDDSSAGIMKRHSVKKKVKALMKEFYPAYSRPAKYYFIDTIPMTNMGKVDRKKMRDS